jgi:hypothetical protein
MARYQHFRSREWRSEMTAANFLEMSWTAIVRIYRRRFNRAADLPGGPAAQNRVQPFQQKYFASPFGRSSFIDSPSRLGHKGRTRRHGRWVRDAVDATATHDERRCGGRRSRVVLMPRRWHQVPDKQASQGRRWQESPVTGKSAK